MECLSSMKVLLIVFCCVVFCQCSSTNDLHTTDWSVAGVALRSKDIPWKHHDPVRQSLSKFLKSDQSLAGSDISISAPPEVFGLLVGMKGLPFTFAPPSSIRNTKNRFFDAEARMTVVLCIETDAQSEPNSLSVWITPLWSPTGPVGYRRRFVFRLQGSKMQLALDQPLYASSGRTSRGWEGGQSGIRLGGKVD